MPHDMIKGLGTVIYHVATVTDPFGNLIGPIENPHFALPKT